MKLKKGVKLTGLQPQILVAIIVADSVYQSKGVELIITSGNDSKHSVNSLHYKGLAVDLRTRYFTQDVAMAVTKEIAENLGNEFDVLFEKNHIHIEYDP